MMSYLFWQNKTFAFIFMDDEYIIYDIKYLSENIALTLVQDLVPKT